MTIMECGALRPAAKPAKTGNAGGFDYLYGPTIPKILDGVPQDFSGL